VFSTRAFAALGLALVTFFSGVESQGISVSGLSGGTRNLGTQTLVN
jgi:hypothetical protein